MVSHEEANVFDGSSVRGRPGHSRTEGAQGKHMRVRCIARELEVMLDRLREGAREEKRSRAKQ